MTFAKILLVFLFVICHTILGQNISMEYLRSLQPPEVAQLIKQEFIHGYAAYKQYAWGCDELHPLTKTCKNWYDYSLMWTPIDALDSLYIMGIDDLLNDTLDLLCSTPFNTNQYVKTFDYFIRSIGGLLSGYYFTKEQCLYDLALELADAVYPVFNEINPSLSGLPWNWINLETKQIDFNAEQQRTSPAVAGSHTLEYGIMSVLTGDLKYFNASMNAMRVLYQAKSPTLGLIGNGINLNKTSDIHSTDMFYSNKSMIDSDIDSYYEYIVKCWALFNNSECKSWWLDVINSTIIDNLSHYTVHNVNETLLWFKRVDAWTGINTPDWAQYDLYSAFYSAVLSLSSTIDANDVNNIYNLQLAIINQEANWFMWNKNDIEPYVYDFNRNTNRDPSYDLNPENFESNYYLYAITKDPIYYDRALQYFYDLVTFCKCEDEDDCVGYSGLSSVYTKQRMDSMASFFFGESLKYLYLTFMVNEANNPVPFDEFVFNTEAHPLPKIWGEQLNDLLSNSNNKDMDISSTLNWELSTSNINMTEVEGNSDTKLTPQTILYTILIICAIIILICIVYGTRNLLMNWFMNENKETQYISNVMMMPNSQKNKPKRSKHGQKISFVGRSKKKHKYATLNTKSRGSDDDY